MMVPVPADQYAPQMPGPMLHAPMAMRYPVAGHPTAGYVVR
jgi:hypothetical protein